MSGTSNWKAIRDKRIGKQRGGLRAWLAIGLHMLADHLHPSPQTVEVETLPKQSTSSGTAARY
jgi:hypothetical protein